MVCEETCAGAGVGSGTTTVVENGQTIVINNNNNNNNGGGTCAFPSFPLPRSLVQDSVFGALNLFSSFVWGSNGVWRRHVLSDELDRSFCCVAADMQERCQLALHSLCFLSAVQCGDLSFLGVLGSQQQQQ